MADVNEAYIYVPTSTTHDLQYSLKVITKTYLAPDYCRNRQLIEKESLKSLICISLIKKPEEVCIVFNRKFSFEMVGSLASRILDLWFFDGQDYRFAKRKGSDRIVILLWK